MSQTAAVPGPETRVLSYHDVFLRQADVDLLTGPDWLNDQVRGLSESCFDGFTRVSQPPLIETASPSTITQRHQAGRRAHYCISTRQRAGGVCLCTPAAAHCLLLYLPAGRHVPWPRQGCVPDATRHLLPAAELGYVRHSKVAGLLLKTSSTQSLHRDCGVNPADDVMCSLLDTHADPSDAAVIFEALQVCVAVWQCGQVVGNMAAAQIAGLVGWASEYCSIASNINQHSARLCMQWWRRMQRSVCWPTIRLC